MSQDTVYCIKQCLGRGNLNVKQKHIYAMVLFVLVFALVACGGAPAEQATTPGDQSANTPSEQETDAEGTDAADTEETDTEGQSEDQSEGQSEEQSEPSGPIVNEKPQQESGDADKIPSEDEQAPVEEALQAFIDAEGLSGVTPDVQAIEGNYARAILMPEEGDEVNPETVFLQRGGDAWTVVAGPKLAFELDEVTELGIPEELAMPVVIQP